MYIPAQPQGPCGSLRPSLCPVSRTLTAVLLVLALAGPMDAEETEVQTLPLSPVGGTLDTGFAVAVSLRYGALIRYHYSESLQEWTASGTGVPLAAQVVEQVVTDDERVVWAEATGVGGADLVVHSTLVSDPSYDQVLVSRSSASVVDMHLNSGRLVVAVLDGLSSSLDVFQWTGSAWESFGAISVGSLLTLDDSVAVGANRIAWGRPGLGDDGGVSIYRNWDLLDGDWQFEAAIQPDFQLQSGAGFGRAVHLSGEDLLLVGAPLYNRGFLPPIRADAGAVLSYFRDGTWQAGPLLQPTTLLPGDARFGSAIDLAGSTAVVGAPGWSSSVTGAVGQGRAFVFTNNAREPGATDPWNEAYRARTSDLDSPFVASELGATVAVARDGILVADPGTGRIYSFTGPIFVDGFESGDATAWQ